MPTLIKFSATLLHYGGDALGNDFQFHLVVRDEHFFSKTFKLAPVHNDHTDLRELDLTYEFDVPDYEQVVYLPVSVIAVETDPPSNKQPYGLVTPGTDFGHNVGLLELKVGEMVQFPDTRVFEMPVIVQGDFGQARGRETNRKAMLKLICDVTVERGNAGNVGENVIAQFDAGRRNFDGDQLDNADLRDQQLPGIVLSNTNLLFANFDASDLYRASFVLAGCHQTIFTNIHGFRAFFDEATLNSAKFDGSNLNETGYAAARIDSTSFQRCQLFQANFQDAELNNVNFQNSNLEDANFGRAKLDRIDFRGCSLKNVNFTGAQLGTINYEGANIEGAIELTVPSTNFDPKDPFEGKSEDYKKGYNEGYERGYPQSGIDEVRDDRAWEKSLKANFPDANADFAAGFEVGFQETYAAGWADK